MKKHSKGIQKACVRYKRRVTGSMKDAVTLPYYM